MTNWVTGGTGQMIQQRSFCSLFCKRPLWAVLAWAGMSPLWCCSSSISSANHGIAHPLRWSEGWFGEAVLVCDVPKPCKFPSIYSCQNKFMWIHKAVDLAPNPVIGLVLQIGDEEKFSQALGLKSLDLFFWESASRVAVSQPKRRMEVTRNNLNLFAKLMVLFHQIRLNGHCWGNPHADFCWAGTTLVQGCSQVLKTGHLL